MGGASEGPFNKRKRRRRNKKGGVSEDRQPMQDAASLKQLDCKKVASRAWKMFLAEGESPREAATPSDVYKRQGQNTYQ